MAGVRHFVHDRGFTEKTTVILVGLLGLATALRLLGIENRVLWYDELYSATFSIQPPMDLLRSVSAHDPHPPLYYLQLHLWLKLGTGETWLRLNSVFWSLLALVPTYFAGRRILGETAGPWAVLLLAVSPTIVYFAHEVRMYAMLTCLVAVNLLVLERLLARDQRWFDLPAFFLTLVAIIYVHGAGFLLLLPVGVYCVLRLGRQLRTALALKVFAALGAAALSALPWLLKAEGTNLSHLRSDGLEAIPLVLLQLLVDRGIETVARPVLLGVFCLAALATLVLLWMPRTRNLTIAYVVVAFGTILVLAYFVTPLWHVKSLVGMMPVLSILLGGLLAKAHDRLQRSPAGAGVLLAGVLAILGPYAVSINDEDDFRRMHFETAQYLLHETGPGDTIVIEDARDFWTLAWYLAGPGSVTVNNEQDDIRLAGGQSVQKQDPAVSPGPGTWQVLRNYAWETNPVPASEETEKLQTFARFVVYRHPE